MKEEKEQVRFQLVISKELKDKLHKAAKEQGLTMSAFIKVVLNKELER